MTTYRDFFDTTEDVYALMLFVGKAHSSGTLTRQRLMQVVVRCCETVAWRMPDASRTALADVAAWAHGDDGVDLHDAYSAADAAYSACSAAADAAYSAYAAAVCSAADAAYSACSAADAAAAAYSALCDVVRDEITVEEVCSALDVNPDEVMT